MVYFKEEQRLGQWKIWIVLMMVNLAVLGTLLKILYERFALHKTLDTLPISEGYVMIISLLSVSILLLANVILYLSKLEVKIDRHQLSYRYPPYVNSWKRVKKEELKAAYMRKYDPVGEFGGWGYKVHFRKNNQGLSTHGNVGLQLVFVNGKKILLGTQKPDVLEKVMWEFMDYRKV